MPAATVPIQLPTPLFQKLQRIAAVTHRSIEEVAAASLEAALPVDPALPTDIANELAAMHLFSDEALRAATVPSLKPDEEYRLQQLNSAAGERDLSPAEEAEQQSLITSYQCAVLRRAQALAILAQRGHPFPIPAETKIADNGGS